MDSKFEGEIFRWTSREQDWFFVALSPELSADIREIPRPRRGFGAVRVDVHAYSSATGAGEWEAEAD